MKNIFVAGHNGMVGSAIYEILKKDKNVNLITASRDELNLLNQSDVLKFLENNTIDQIYLCAAKVGGVYANNTYPAEFIYENLQIQNNVIHGAFLSNIKKLLFLGSSCIYPKFAEQPIKESYLLSGFLEQTNEPYAIAKIAGIKLCESYNRQYSNKGIDYRSVMPTNLYGDNDNFDKLNGHVIPALIRRCYEAVKNNSEYIIVWGTGSPKREFLHVTDMASACILVMNLEYEEFKKVTLNPQSAHINVGCGTDISISELVAMLIDISGFKGKIKYDSSFPDGTMKKLMDSSKLRKLGWEPKIKLYDGLKDIYRKYEKKMSE